MLGGRERLESEDAVEATGKQGVPLCPQLMAAAGGLLVGRGVGLGVGRRERGLQEATGK